MNGPRIGELDVCKVCGEDIIYEEARRGGWWRHTKLLLHSHAAEPERWIKVDRTCHLNCNSEGPPGPIWCTECGHDPKCCTCEIEYELVTNNDEPREYDASAEQDTISQTSTGSNERNDEFQDGFCT
jgi:hypothetical protein